MLTKAAVLFAASVAVLGPATRRASARQGQHRGNWGGENAGLMADDTSAHVHIGCTYGNIHQAIFPDSEGRFDVPASRTSPRIRSTSACASGAVSGQ
jgi:hypothetical protein